MKTIYKYPVDGSEALGDITLNIPQGGQVLDVQVQGGIPCIWVLVESTKPIVQRVFRIIGTGHRINVNTVLDYIGTFQLDNGDLVYHLFEVLG